MHIKLEVHCFRWACCNVFYDCLMHEGQKQYCEQEKIYVYCFGSSYAGIPSNILPFCNLIHCANIQPIQEYVKQQIFSASVETDLSSDSGLQLALISPA